MLQRKVVPPKHYTRLDHPVWWLRQERVEIPDEFFLRELAALDERDVGQLLDVENEWGPLAHPGDDPLAFLPTSKYLVSKVYDPYERLNRRIQRSIEPQAGTRYIPVKIVQLHATVLKALARHWLLHAVNKLDEEWERTWEATPLSPPNIEAAWRMFFMHLDHGLQHFSFHVWSPDVDWKPSQPNLYMATCLQIYNHICVRATYHQCANENCRLYFHHQRGRSRSGQQRNTGVKYCSTHCARAQAQRAYRRRQLNDQTKD